MKAATVTEIKKELKLKSKEELLELCLSLAKFKKENKELLTYLLYEASDEEAYIHSVKNEIDLLFEEINTQSYYWMNKTLRKILRMTKKYIRYSKKKTTEVELLIYFIQKMLNLRPSIKNSTGLNNLYERLLLSIQKSIAKLHDIFCMSIIRNFP
jgi:DNA polymerase III gamma/tau subunit